MTGQPTTSDLARRLAEVANEITRPLLQRVSIAADQADANKVNVAVDLDRSYSDALRERAEWWYDHYWQTVAENEKSEKDRIVTALTMFTLGEAVALKLKDNLSQDMPEQSLSLDTE